MKFVLLFVIACFVAMASSKRYHLDSDSPLRRYHLRQSKGNQFFRFAPEEDEDKKSKKDKSKDKLEQALKK